MYSRIAIFAAALALFVVVLGAYTRLTHAGLGCPDWPGCYGHMVLPTNQQDRAQAQKAFPHTPIEARKAWTEMAHRYAAGTLGLFIAGLAITAIFERKKRNKKRPLFLPILIVGLVIFQALLGMWTVTLKLLPVVVMGHLMGGMTILSLLWLLGLSTGNYLQQSPELNLAKLKPWAILGLVITVLQIFLGGWTSANYAALSCPDFPFCQGHLIPPMDFKDAFNFFAPIGANFHGGYMENAARMTINTLHRFGGVITGLYLGALSIYLIISNKSKSLRIIGGVILIAVAVQILLGILNIILFLPLSIADAHNAGAAILLLSVVTLNYSLWTNKKND